MNNQVLQINNFLDIKKILKKKNYYNKWDLDYELFNYELSTKIYKNDNKKDILYEKINKSDNKLLIDNMDDLYD